MRASESKWPYRPVHITNDGESHGGDLGKLTSVGIVQNEYIQGLQNSISADLGYPTIILEFPPGPKVKPVRTDSKLLAPYGVRPACDKLRKYTDFKLCYHCDNMYALLFRGLSKTNLSTKIGTKLKDNAYLKELRQDAYIKNYLSDPEIEINLKTINGRKYLESDCWLLALRGLNFPIFFEGKVIAVFVTGQICLGRRSKFIKRRHKEFLSANADCFFKKVLGEKNLLTKGFKQELLDMYKEWIGANKKEKVLKEHQYEELIRNCCDKIEGLERMLVEQMSLQRNRYVRRRAERRIEKFRENLPTKKQSSDEKWELLWENVKMRLNELCSDFAIKYILAFADKEHEKEEPSLLDVVAATEGVPENIQKCINSGRIKFNMEKIPENIRGQWVTSLDDRRVFDALEGFPGKLRRDTNVIRINSLSLSHKALFVVLVAYYKRNPPMTEENKWSNYSSSAPPNTFYTVVLSALSLVLAEMAEAKLRTTVRVLHHEINNSIQVLYQRMPQVLKEIPKKTLGREAIKLGFKNIEDGLKLLEQYTIWPRFIAGKYSVNPTKVPVLSMMYKWRDFYATEIYAKYLTVKLPPVKVHDTKHPKPLADAELLEYGVSNLIKNAVKYAYDGTIIDLNSYKVAGKRLNKIEVSNYGFKIKENEKESIYKLFYRTPRAEEITGKDDGQGAGLFVVKACIDAHKWPFELPESIFISKFCVPILYWLEKNNSWKAISNKKLRDEAKSEYVLKKEQIDAICSVRFLRRKYNFMIEGSLVKETCKNVFKIVIPDMERY